MIVGGSGCGAMAVVAVVAVVVGIGAMILVIEDGGRWEAGRWIGYEVMDWVGVKILVLILDSVVGYQRKAF